LLVVLVLLGAATSWSLLVTVPLLCRVVRPHLRRDGVTVGAALIVGGSALSLLATTNLGMSLTTLGGITGAFAVTATLAWWWRSSRRLSWGLGAFVVVACCLVLVGTIQVDIDFAKLNSLSIAVYGWFRRWPHLDNVGFSQNATAALIVAVLPFAVAFAVRAGSLARRGLAASAVLWLLFAVVITLSRGAYFGVSLGLAAMIWLAGGKTRWLAPAPPLATVGLLLLGVTGYEFTLTTTPTGWSSADRLYIWHAALRILADFPITGPGSGAFPLLFPYYTWPNDGRYMPHAHNFLLQTYLDSGIAGLIGLAVMGLTFVAGIRHLLGKTLPAELRMLTIAAAGSAVGIFAHGSVDAYFWGDARTFYVVFVPLAVFLAVWRLSGQGRLFPENLRLPPWRWQWPRGHAVAAGATPGAAALLGIGAMLVALLVGLGVPPLTSLALTNSGNVLRSHGELLPAGAPLQAWFYRAAQWSFQRAGLIDIKNGIVWQDLADVYLDEGDTTDASLCLELASKEGEQDTLIARDTNRLDMLAIARAGTGTRVTH